MSSSASKYFGEMVAGYDSLIRRAVPRYDEMIARLVAYLPATCSHALELGCGTGNCTLRLAERYPGAEITMVDAAPEMLEATQRRLASLGIGSPDRYHAHESRFESITIDAGRVDLVTSCISLHHVADKPALFTRLHALLASGGTIAFADQMAGGTKAFSAINWDRWLEFCRAGETCTEEEIRSLIDHAEAHDHYEPVYEQMRMLESAGFTAIDCVWRNWMWGIVVASRP